MYVCMYVYCIYLVEWVGCLGILIVMYTVHLYSIVEWVGCLGILIVQYIRVGRVSRKESARPGSIRC